MPETVLILAGGNPPTPNVRRALPPAAMCIAADHGTDHAHSLGIRPDLIVGDLDSVSPEALAWAEAARVRIERHPQAKAQTDLELALERAVETGTDKIVVAGIGGGRLDHLLANFMVLADERWSSAAIDALVGTAHVSIVHSERMLTGRPDELVSLLPVGADAQGVTTSGLGYPLLDEDLGARSSRGVSNYFIETTATVSLRSGTLLAVQPDRLQGVE